MKSPRPDLATATVEYSGAWSLDASGIAPVDAFETRTPTVLVPSEDVLVTAVDLPLPGRRQRAAALPFALEDRLAEPLDELHIVLGQELSPRRHLAGIVRHQVMRGWLARLAEAGLSDCALVPDALALPEPVADAWSVRLAGGRALVRTGDGRAFAVPSGQLAAVWAAGGEPPCVSYGEPLPSEVQARSVEPDPAMLAHGLRAPALNLRQGPYAVARRPVAAAWRRLALVVAGGAAAHAAIASADTMILRGIAQDRREEVQALIRQVAPEAPVDGDLTQLTALLPSGAGSGSRFVALLARASQALAPLAPEIDLRGLSYSEDGSLRLHIEGSELAALQRSEAALAAEGLGPVSGAVNAESGQADGEIVVRDPIGGATP